MATVFPGAPVEGRPIQRLNYGEESEKAVNQQINRELFAHYTYMSMVRFLKASHVFQVFFFFIAGSLNS